MQPVIIRKASETEHETLTRIAFSAKRHWAYPEEYIAKWALELTIAPEYIRYNVVHIAEVAGQIVGFYSIFYLAEEMTFGKVRMEKGHWLDHMFILPEYHGKRIGSTMVQHIKESGKYSQLHIFVDPNAIGFYEKAGAKFVRMSPSSIADREIPVYCLYTSTSTV